MFKGVSCKRTLDKSACILPVVAFVVALGLRYFFLSKYHRPMMLHEQDAVGYMDVAKSIIDLHVPSVTGRPPGYPIVIALFSLLPVELEYAARLASIFMDSLIVIPLFYIARIYLSRLGAFAASLLWALFSFSLYFSTSPLSQSSYLCFLLSGVALLHLGYKDRRMFIFLASGMLMALSYLARPEGIVGCGCGLLFCLTLAFDKDGFHKKNLSAAICFLVGVLLLAGPYLVALRIALGGWTLSALSAVQVNGVDAVLKLNASGDLHKTASTGLSAWKVYSSTIPTVLQTIRDNTKGFATLFINTFPLWMDVLTGAGVVYLAWKNSWRDSYLILILLLVISPTLVVNLPKMHSYLYPLFAMSFICFVAGLEAVVRGGAWIAEKIIPAVQSRFVEATLSAIMFLPIGYIAFAFVNIAHASYQAPRLLREVMETEKVYKGAGEIIKNNSQPNDVIMTRWGLVGYFAGRPVLSLPDGDVKAVVEYGRKSGARFLLIDSNSVLTRRRGLMELLGPLQGKMVNPAYCLEPFSGNYFPEIDSGYVIYRYKK